MFVVRPKTDKDMAKALFFLSQYQVSFFTVPDGCCGPEGYITEEVFIVVDEESNDGDLRMVELMFQMNFKQEGGPLCPMCNDLWDETCEHLTFTEVIRR